MQIHFGFSLKLLWLTLVQPTSNCEIEFLPVYHPSEEEKTDPKLYANNVRKLMAKYLSIILILSLVNFFLYFTINYKNTMKFS